MIGQDLVGSIDLYSHFGLKPFHHPGDFCPDGIGDGPGLFGTLPDNLVFLFDRCGLGLTELLLVSRHLFLNGGLETLDFRFGLFKLLFSFFN